MSDPIVVSIPESQTPVKKKYKKKTKQADLPPVDQAANEFKEPDPV